MVLLAIAAKAAVLNGQICSKQAGFVKTNRTHTNEPQFCLLLLLAKGKETDFLGERNV